MSIPAPHATRQDYTVEIIADPQHKRAHLELLLLADPEIGMVERYLDRSEMFVWRASDGTVIGEAVVAPDGEIKNLAVSPARQRQGWGRVLLEELCRHYRGRFEALTVGTSNCGIPFYERCGFRYWRTLPRFFVDHYAEPVIDEDGSRCIDMHLLRRPL